MLRDNCPDTGCGIKVYWREAFLRLPFFTSMHRYLPALFQTYGYEVAYQPVNDRPRTVGVSKYNNLGRALVGIYDLFGVTWIRRPHQGAADRRGSAGEGGRSRSLRAGCGRAATAPEEAAATRADEATSCRRAGRRGNGIGRMGIFAELAQWWSKVSALDLAWLTIGLGGQVLFSARWIIQWLASERMKRSIVPEMFWYCSLIGGCWCWPTASTSASR